MKVCINGGRIGGAPHDKKEETRQEVPREAAVGLQPKGRQGKGGEDAEEARRPLQTKDGRAFQSGHSASS